MYSRFLIKSDFLNKIGELLPYYVSLNYVKWKLDNEQMTVRTLSQQFPVCISLTYTSIALIVYLTFILANHING